MTHRFSNLLILVSIAYGAYSIVGFAIFKNSQLDLTFFGISMTVGLLTILGNRMRTTNATDSIKTSFQQVASVSYMLILCLAILVFLQYNYSLLFFAFQLIAFITGTFGISDRLRRYLGQLALMLPSSIYATELIVVNPTPETDNFLLVFYIVWLLMISSLDYRWMSQN
jgi:hypothetical protein